MGKIRVGITIGDVNGIGLEVIIKTLSHPSIVELCTPVIYGSSKVVSYHKNIVKPDEFSFSTTATAEKIYHQRINVVNVWQEDINIELGKETQEAGKIAHIALDQAVRDLKDGYIDTLVTAPVSKNAMKLAGFPYPGHTEFLANAFDVKEGLMMMVADDQRVALVTAHTPLREVPEAITAERLKSKLNTLIDTLKIDFGISRPTVAVLGLNPHAGENGTIGKEEEEIIRPAILECKKSGNVVMGPYPADGFYGSVNFKKYDAILAMYHDQGLIPFKLLNFDHGVNYTAGLPFIRTSPDHGTAFDIAGKNEADPESFRAALYTAIDLFKARQMHEEDTENALQKTPKPAQHPGGK